MEFRQLRYLVVLGEKLHFQRAADALHISQPTLSQQVAELEQELGVALFSRNRHQTRLTPAGMAFLEDAKRILQLADRMVVAAKQNQSGEIGHLIIGCVGSASAALLPTLLSSYQDNFPFVSIELRELPTSLQVHALVEGSLDIAFVRPPITRYDDIRLVTVLQEPLLAIVATGHPLAGKPQITVSDLSDEPFVLFRRQEGPGLYDQIISLCSGLGFTPSISYQATNIHTIMSLVAAGLGVSLIPRSFRDFARQGVTQRDLSHCDVRVEIGMAWHAQNDNPCLPPFIEAAQRLAAEL